jgi:hypothetical protein
VVAILGQIGKVREIAESTNDGDRLGGTQPVEQLIQVTPGRNVGPALEGNGEPPDRLDNLKGALALLLAHGIAQELAEETYIIL